MNPDSDSHDTVDSSTLRQLPRHEVDELWAEYLSRGHTLSLEVASDSMSPLIVTGDHILVEPIPEGDNIRVGEIVLFRTADGWLVHRVVGVSSKTPGAAVLQKGDAGHHAHQVPPQAIMGRVVRVEKKDGGSLYLDGRFARGVNMLVGRAFQLIEWAMSRGGDLGRDTEAGSVSSARVRASGLIRNIERGVARLGSLLVRKG